MKAIGINSFGGSDVLELIDTSEPAINSTQVLVDIYATSVNPVDSKVRQGLYHNNKSVTFPYFLGRDFSGVIKACGTSISQFKIGDPVFGVLAPGCEGTYLETLSIEASLIAHKPNDLPHIEAAAIVLAGLTSLVAIEDTLKLQANERILIHGGAGGVGSFAVQLAHHIGSEVITTASLANHTYLKYLGADQVIDYNVEDFSNILSDIDVVFDLIGGKTHQRSHNVLKSNGRMAYIAPLLPGAQPPRDNIKVIRPNVQRDRAHLIRIIELYESGAIVAPYIQLFPLSEVQKAHDLIDTNHVRGKIILEIK
jgi:NADPH:quinone reductase-like Zn-dependent oxidoreductase